MIQGGIGGPEVLVEKSEKVLSQLSEAWTPRAGVRAPCAGAGAGLPATLPQHGHATQ